MPSSGMQAVTLHHDGIDAVNRDAPDADRVELDEVAGTLPLAVPIGAF